MTHAGNRDPDDPMRIGGVGAPRSSAGAEEVARVKAEPTQAVNASGDAPPLGSTEAIAEALASGAIDATEAKAQLIEQAVQARLPAEADPALVAEVRAEVAALLEADPLLEALLQQ